MTYPRWLRNTVDLLYAYRFIIAGMVTFTLLVLIPQSILILSGKGGLLNHILFWLFLPQVLLRPLYLKSFIRPRYEYGVERNILHPVTKGYFERDVKVARCEDSLLQLVYAKQHVFLEDHVMGKFKEDALVNITEKVAKDEVTFPDHSRWWRVASALYSTLIENKLLRGIGIATPKE